MSQSINIAIDGHSSCGKGTLAKAIASELSYLFIDSGAMYRAVTLAIIRNKISLDDLQSIEELLPTLQIEFDYNEGSNFHHIILNDVDVEKEIRSMKVANLVSPVSKISAVRKFLVTRQQLLGFKKGVVMDGRDIGTV
ncbi:MAG: (d)CMP kinase, partial [Bacteroidia bacterium]|nr:(d)CMP kinase [Bacteroidia bacterium]